MNLPTGYTKKDFDGQCVAQSAHAAGTHDAKAMTHTVCRATPAEWEHAAACYQAGWKIGKIHLQEQMDMDDILERQLQRRKV